MKIAIISGFFMLGAFMVTPLHAATSTNEKITVEPIPESQILQNAPAAPQLPANWSKQLEEQHEAITTNHIRIHVFRLRPGDDLLGSIRTYVKQHHIQAAVILSAVGSLTQASIRYANQSEAYINTGHFEIVSITGTLEEGGEHLHLSIATGQGNVLGGHLLTGCTIYTTAEIVLAELTNVRFTRELDKEGSGWDELKVYPKIMNLVSLQLKQLKKLQKKTVKLKNSAGKIILVV